MIVADDLTKRYGERTALDGVTFRVEPGETVGVIGPNGAGKSTLLDLLVGYMPPSSGDVRILGTDPWTTPDIRRRIGILPSDCDLYRNATPEEHLDYVRMAKDVNETEYSGLLAEVELDYVADQKVKTFSSGMRQRLLLAICLVGSPDVVLLDEPFSSLDQDGISIVENRLRQEQTGDRSIVVTSHNVGLLEDACGRFFRIDDGVLTER